nr:hypothetical protein [Tanacetum cinerariifolium]
MYVIEQPLPATYAVDSEANMLAEWNVLYDAYDVVACLMLDSMTPGLHRQYENYSSYEMLQELKSMFEKQAGVERLSLIQTFHACKQKKGKPIVAYVLQMKGYVDQLERLGYMLPQDLIVGLILNGLTKDFAGFVRIYNMHNMGKTIGELHAMLIEYEKEHPVKDETCHHCKEVGHWKRNYHVYLAELLKKKKQVGSTSSSEVLFQFTVCNGIFEIDMHDLVPNVNSIYNVSTKRAKHNLDSTYQWHWCLALTTCGIVQQLTPPYTPQRNGVSERRNRTLLDMVRSMMNLTTLSLCFWDYALESATCILNMVSTKKVDKTPYELCGRAIDLEEIQDEDTSPSEITSEIPMEVEGFEPPQEEVISIRRQYGQVMVDLPLAVRLLGWNAVYDAHNEVVCLMLASMTLELHRQLENSSPYEMLQKLKSMFEKQAGVERFDLIQTFHAWKQKERKPVSPYVIKIKNYVTNYNMHNMGKTIGELHALLIEYEIGLPKKAATPQVMAIQGGRIQKANKKSLNTKGNGKGKGKGKDKSYIHKPKNPKTSAKEHLTKDDTCHHCKEVGHWKRSCHAYLAELIKKKKQVGTASSSDIFTIELFYFHNKSWVYDTGRGTQICNTKKGPRGERKLKQGALYLFMGNGIHAQVEAIGSYDLVLPSGLVICLDNCHYALSITRGVVSVSHLVDNGFIQCFTDYEILVSKINVLYSNAISGNGIYEIDMLNLVSNVNSIYNDSHFIILRMIIVRLTPPYTPQHNGVSERRNPTLLDMVRSMMNLTTLPLSFWDYALETATRIFNMVPTKKSSHRSHGQNNDRYGSDRRGGNDNHRGSNNNYSGSNNRNSGNGRDQRNRGHQSNRSTNSGNSS